MTTIFLHDVTKVNAEAVSRPNDKTVPDGTQVIKIKIYSNQGEFEICMFAEMKIRTDIVDAVSL